MNYKAENNVSVLDNVYPDFSEIKNTLKEYSKSERSVKDTEDLNRIRRMSDFSVTLSKINKDLQAFILRKIFDYYIVESYTLRKVYVFQRKKKIYRWLELLSQKERKGDYDGDIGATRAFNEFDRIYDRW